MKIEITDQMTLSEIQNEFHELFPFLKIEFYSKPHQTHEPSSKSSMLKPSTLVKDCRTIHNDGNIFIHGGLTVERLEHIFQECYGLSVQVFRKSGSVWIETTVTDDWTLNKQNEEAESFFKASDELNESERNILGN
ncbi:MAG: hypothetical protein HOP11_01445 [Saprospiraceae bacterium]|nr:hypothetical protein [Saprospiraceae bacterium]